MHNSGDRYENIDSPWKSKNIKRVAKGRYTALASTITNSARTNNKKEIEQVCSETHGSILADSHQASWETIWCEVSQQMPCLVKLLSGLVDSSDKKPMLCLIISMTLKSHCKNISLAQRAISVFLYGNGVTKLVISDILHTYIIGLG